MDYNISLSNSVRTELIGWNMSTVTVNEFTRDRENMWQPPKPGMPGIFCCGHETDAADVLLVSVYDEGRELEMRPMRHRWTPAWSDTHYRSAPDTAYYANSGCVCMRERKCITPENVFVSEITVINDKNCDTDIKLRLAVPFEKRDDAYYIDACIVPGALHDNYRLKGWFVLCGAAEKVNMRLKAGERRTVKLCFAFNNDKAAAFAAAEAEFSKKDSFAENAEKLNKWFDEHIPKLECADAELEKVYLYRCLLVYINTFAPRSVIPEHYLPERAMYESRYGSWFGAPIGLPLPLQANEARWLDAELAARQVELLNDQKHVSMYINTAPRSAMELYRITGDRVWLNEVYDMLRDFTLAKCRNVGELPVTTGSWVVGAEHQPSYYQYREPAWDWHYDANGVKLGFEAAKLYRLDEITYYAQNLNACAEMAAILGRTDDAGILARMRDAVKERLEGEFWNDADGIFYDIDFETGKQCDLAACYDSFAPYADGIVNDERFGKAFVKLFDREWFGDEFSVTTVARRCPMFWFDNCIVGPTAASPAAPYEYGACWNGPIWPYAVSLVLHGLGSYAAEHPEYRAKWLELFAKFTKLHFLDGDMSVPCITEHYRPGDGRSFSSAVDYFHSGYVDFVMRYWAGIRPREGEIDFDPFTDEEFTLRGVHIGRQSYTFRQYVKNSALCREYYVE